MKKQQILNAPEENGIYAVTTRITYKAKVVNNINNSAHNATEYNLWQPLINNTTMEDNDCVSSPHDFFVHCCKHSDNVWLSGQISVVNI